MWRKFSRDLVAITEQLQPARMTRQAGICLDMISLFLCEERCRYCGGSVESALLHSRDDSKLMNGSFRNACLCSECTQRLHENCQTLWWLPVSPPKQGTRSSTTIFPVVTAGIYQGPLRKLIRRLKYDNDRLVVRDIFPLLLKTKEVLQSVWLDGASIEHAIFVPVPLHPDRERKRGYNQAALMAEQLATEIGARFDATLLRRTKRTRPQFGLSKLERQENVKEAFALSLRSAGELGPIILVDDVFTSGATLSECASLLTAGGAAFVAAIAAARAPFRSDA